MKYELKYRIKHKCANFYRDACLQLDMRFRPVMATGGQDHYSCYIAQAYPYDAYTTNSILAFADTLRLDYGNSIEKYVIHKFRGILSMMNEMQCRNGKAREKDREAEEMISGWLTKGWQSIMVDVEDKESK